MAPQSALEKAFLSGDYRRFNSQPTRSGGFLSHVTVRGKKLRHFDLSKVEFAFCTFDRVAFFDLENVEFTECTFKNCRFEKHGLGPMHIIATKFIRCKFAGVAFTPAKVLGSEFKRCSFRRAKMTSEGTTIADTVFSDCDGIEHVKGLSLVSLPESVGYRPFTPRWPDLLWRIDHWFSVAVNWRSLAFFSRLPILNISYVFLVALMCYVIAIGSLFDLASLLIGRLPEAARPVLRPEEWLEWMRRVAIPRQEALWVVAAFLLLAIGGTIYKLGAPTQVQEYSLDKWTLELNKHRLNHAAFIRVRPWAYTVASVLTLFAFGIMVSVTVLKFDLIIAALRG